MKFSMHQDVQPIYSLGGWKSENLGWIHTDKAGHVHKYENDLSLPTLDKVEERNIWYCDDCMDDHEDVEITYFCKVCRDEVQPGLKTNTGPIYQYGRTHYYIDDQEVSKDEFMTKSEGFWKEGDEVV